MADLLQRTLEAAGQQGTSTLTLVEVQKRAWRVLMVAGGERPRITDETELAAVTLKLRDQSRGRGAQPTPCAFGLELAGKLAKHAGHAIWVQVAGTAESRSEWVSP